MTLDEAQWEDGYHTVAMRIREFAGIHPVAAPSVQNHKVVVVWRDKAHSWALAKGWVKREITSAVEAMKHSAQPMFWQGWIDGLLDSVN